MGLSWQDRYQARREPDRRVRLMSLDDVPGALELLQKIGWNHIQHTEWDRLLHWAPDGCFVVEDASKGILATVSTTLYGTALGWIGMMVVAPEHQRQGLGRQLIRAALDHLIDRGTERIMLDATEQGRPLYEQMGFRALHKIERWEGKASTYMGARADRMRSQHLEAAAALDCRLMGMVRPHILRRLFEEFPNLAWIDIERGTVEGFLLGRKMGAGYYLGPWMSNSAKSAEKLLLTALEQLQGQQVTLNISDQNGRGLILASDHNLRRTQYTMRMIYGNAIPISGEPLAELSIASHATG
ncbi:MAG TPA: GNAT family N-acetyltransferase [Aggregatilineaceae bacterium]|nr:GNAT family N-acetyltransferase [Aggregatilineaceae bacterium]